VVGEDDVDLVERGVLERLGGGVGLVDDRDLVEGGQASGQPLAVDQV
jgi:hypothetical protein